MTVCIAAACRDEDRVEKIVFCADKKLTSLLGSAETGDKILWIAPHWRILTAGDQPDIMALRRLYRLRFKDKENRTAEKIDESIKTPLRQRKKEISDEYTYSHFNMSYDEFLAKGKQQLPDEHFRNAVRAIGDLDLNAALIIAGFVDGSAEIYWTDPYGSAKAAPDFAVVGEGQHLAQSALLRRKQNSRTSVQETLYNVFEAKKISQSVGSVGEETAMLILAAKGDADLTSFGVDRQLDKLYTVYGPRALPTDFKLEGPLYFSEELAAEKAVEDAARQSEQPTLDSASGYFSGGIAAAAGNSEEAGPSVAEGAENVTNKASEF